jgi:hypothetical protein
MNELIPYIIYALIGSLANIIRELARLEGITSNFKLSVWIKKNKYKTVYSLLIAVCTIFLLNGLGELTVSSAILTGFAGDALIKTKVSKSMFGTGSDSIENKNNPNN